MIDKINLNTNSDSNSKEVMRIALGLEYDGSEFHGWQKQESVLSVQSVLESALSKVANEPIATICAGRTDAGVHATYQVVHFNTTAIRSEYAWVAGTNRELPNSIVINWAKVVPKTFDARRSAVKRHYRYILYSHKIRPSILRNHISWTYHSLELDRMQKAAQHWIGKHDFSSFRASQCQSLTPIREIISLEIKQINNYFIFDFIANAFLHHMIRNMVAILIDIGSGKKNIEWAKEVLELRNRNHGGVTASPNGLYLMGVEYAQEFGLPLNKQYNLITSCFY